MDNWLYTRPEVYDLFYSRKAYEAEAAFMADCIGSVSTADEEKVLVIGCGTGEHTKYLTNAGYEVIGVDLHRTMLEAANEKSNAAFVTGSVPNIGVSGNFAAVLLPFGVLNYIEPDVLDTVFDELKQLVADRGILLFDIVNRQEEPLMAIQTERTADAEYCRLIQITPLADARDKYEYVIFSNEGDRPQFHVVVEMLNIHNSRLADHLNARGFAFETYDGYDTGGYLDDKLTVFVAHNDGDESTVPGPNRE